MKSEVNYIDNTWVGQISPFPELYLNGTPPNQIIQSLEHLLACRESNIDLF
jgi:hypothetical protein